MSGKGWARAHLFGAAAVAEPPAADPAGWLARLELGPAHVVGEIELWPLLHPLAGAAADLLAAEAIQAGVLDVREKDGGTVQELVATSRAARAVVLIEGEVLVGAKQNRMVAHTVVIAPGATVVVPVGCVERGRWDWRSPHFAGSGFVAAPALRRSAQASVAAARAATGRVTLDQRALWSEVDAALEEAGVESATSDYHELQQRQRAGAAAAAARIEPTERQVGVLALRQGLLVALDLVGSAGTWRAVGKRLTAALLPATWSAPRAGGPRRGAAEWLREVRSARVSLQPAIGAGVSVELAADGLAGSGVWLEGRFVHLAGFARG